MLLSRLLRMFVAVIADVVSDDYCHRSGDQHNQIQEQNQSIRDACLSHRCRFLKDTPRRFRQMTRHSQPETVQECKKRNCRKCRLKLLNAKQSKCKNAVTSAFHTFNAISATHAYFSGNNKHHTTKLEI